MKQYFIILFFLSSCLLAISKKRFPFSSYDANTRSTAVTCGEILEEYELVENISMISKEVKNEKIMISYNITNGERAVCTALACTSDNPCCNACGSTPMFDDILLYPESGEVNLGCGGSNCNTKTNCVYKDGDRVIVYGTVASNDIVNQIIVDFHCLDKGYYNLEESVQDNLVSEEIRKEDVTLSSTLSSSSKSNTTCQDVTNDFMVNDGVSCARYLGAAVMNGTCQGVSGCDEMGYAFFNSIDDCVSTCFLVTDAATTTISDSVSEEEDLSLPQEDMGTSPPSDAAGTLYHFSFIFQFITFCTALNFI